MGPWQACIALERLFMESIFKCTSRPSECFRSLSPSPCSSSHSITFIALCSPVEFVHGVPREAGGGSSGHPRRRLANPGFSFSNSSFNLSNHDVMTHES